MKKKKILVIDDIVEITAMMSKMLSAINYEVETAANGQEALELLQSGSYDLIITDHYMPIMNGADFIKEKIKLKNKTPVIFLSSYDSTSLSQYKNQANIVSILHKPVEFQEITEIIKKHI